MGLPRGLRPVPRLPSADTPQQAQGGGAREDAFIVRTDIASVLSKEGIAPSICDIVELLSITDYLLRGVRHPLQSEAIAKARPQ